MGLAMVAVATEAGAAATKSALHCRKSPLKRAFVQKRTKLSLGETSCLLLWGNLGLFVRVVGEFRPARVLAEPAYDPSSARLRT